MLEHSGGMWSGHSARVPPVSAIRPGFGAGDGDASARRRGAGRHAPTYDQGARGSGYRDQQDDRPAARPPAAGPLGRSFATQFRDVALKRLLLGIVSTVPSI